MRFLISVTRFSTNCFHSCSVHFIYARAIFESVKQTGCSKSKSFLRKESTVFSNLARSNTESSPNLGIIIGFIGATLVLEARSAPELPLRPTTHRYTIEAYALWDAP